MANQEQLELLRRDIAAWNRWRELNPSVRPDLQEANLQGADLSRARLLEVNLERARLADAKLPGAKLHEANLRGADLRRADLHGADLTRADLSGTNLSQANFQEANLHQTNLRGARLPEADLQYAHLIQADLAHADLTGCLVYGISVWDTRLDGAMQDELVISRTDGPAIRADRLEVAQFVYLLLNYHDLDAVVAAMNSKVVLILGHFTAGRRAVLTRLREELHRRGYLTLSFDFSTSWSGGLTRIVSTLAHLSRFIIVDITEAGGAHPAFEAISPFFDHVPTRVLLQVGGAGGAVGEDGELVRSFAPRAIHRYASLDDLRSSFDTAIVLPAETSREDQHP